MTVKSHQSHPQLLSHRPSDTPTPQPAVVTLTTSVGALGATEFLLRLTGLGKTDATELLLRSHLGELRRSARSPRLGCFCTNPDFIGRGTRAPYLDLAGVLQ